MDLTVRQTADFDLTGRGASPAWEGATWQELTRVSGDSAYRTRFKALHSSTGLYVLFDAEDRRLTCTKTRDMDDIFTEDVVEAFFWPDESQNLYFEYELSPMNVELPILVPNHKGRFCGWAPWHYEAGRRTRHATSVYGGERRSMASVDGWMAEFFIPFDLFVGLGNVPPRPGRTWRANFYRWDYDAAPPSQWAWDSRTGGEFHDFKNFGILRFAD